MDLLAFIIAAFSSIVMFGYYLMLFFIFFDYLKTKTRNNLILKILDSDYITILPILILYLICFNFNDNLLPTLTIYNSLLSLLFVFAPYGIIYISVYFKFNMNPKFILPIILLGLILVIGVLSFLYGFNFVKYYLDIIGYVATILTIATLLEKKVKKSFF